MSKKMTKDELKTGRDFLDYAAQNGAKIRNGAGSHYVVSTSKGASVVPVHGNKELGKGLRHSIIKQFITIGLGLLVIILPIILLGAFR